MRLFITLLFIFSLDQLTGQNIKIGKVNGDYVNGNKTVYNSFISVIQGDKVVKYNLSDSNQCSKLLNYLPTIPGIDNEMKQVIKYSKQIFVILKRKDI